MNDRRWIGMRPAICLCAVSAAVLVLAAGCGGGSSTTTVTVTTGGPAAWPGPPAAVNGTVPITGFHGAERSAIDTAAAFLRFDLRSLGALTSVVSVTPPEDQRSATVTVTLDRLLDDSVRAQRYVLAMQQEPSGLWTIRSAAWSQRCQPGRGHQTFTAARCV